MRIAIIGSGISGLSAAYIAAPHADITLYERDARIGGHTHTHTIHHGEATLHVDSGFMVFNPPQYPHFCALLKELEIESVETTMSFSVDIPGEVTYASNALLADKQNLLRPQYYVFLYHIVRFMRLAKRVLRKKIAIDPSETLGDFLVRYKFPRSISDWYLSPMLGAIWSCNKKDVFRFPALNTFEFLNNHLLLDVLNTARWRTIPRGSATYAAAIVERLRVQGKTVRVNTPITAITRKDDKVLVTAQGEVYEYDYCLIATHADTALSLLTDSTTKEREILGAFTYSSNRAVIHRDTTAMPDNRAAWASWNYAANAHDDSMQNIHVTYSMNHLQHIDPQLPVFVTLNPPYTIPSEKIFAEVEYTHPVFTPETRAAQERLHEIQNKQRTLFAGAHWGYGFHEDGIRSSINALNSVGIHAPWQRL